MRVRVIAFANHRKAESFSDLQKNINLFWVEWYAEQ